MSTVRRRAPLISAALLVLAACSSDSATVSDSRTIAKFQGDGQTAAAGSTVAIRPAARIVDQSNAPVSGIAVTFAIATGGGNLVVSGGTAPSQTVTTGSDGVAIAADWALGTLVGANTLTATATGITGSPVAFTATGSQPPPAAVTKFSGDNQTGVVGTGLAGPPTIKVVDANGNPCPGVAVSFTVTSGGGSVANGGVAITSAAGVAFSQVWTLGPVAGTNTLTATVAGSGIAGNPVTFTAIGH